MTGPDEWLFWQNLEFIVMEVSPQCGLEARFGAADSQHLGSECVGRFVKDRGQVAAIARSTNTSALTRIDNDHGLGDVFQWRVMDPGLPGDCLVAISTSGDSPHVIKAAQAACSADIRTIGLLGRDGGALAALCDLAIVVPSQTTARIQEAHIFIGHTLCALVEQRLSLA
jgi:D-sedoheptulose 7-phosphate isomerase